MRCGSCGTCTGRRCGKDGHARDGRRGGSGKNGRWRTALPRDRGGNGERNLRIRDCGSSGGIVFAWMDRYPGDLTAGEKPVDRGERRDVGGELCTGTVFLPE